MVPTIPEAGDVLIYDILTFGYVDDGDGNVETEDSVENNAIYRSTLEETSDGGVFEGTLEYIMLNQVNFNNTATYDGITVEGDELVLIIDNGYTGSDAPQVSYADETARVEVDTSSGTVSLDSDSYSTYGTVTVTLVDQDLNVDDADTESYTVMQDGTVRDYDSTAPLLEFTIDDQEWTNCAEDKDLGLPADFTLEELSDSPGTFTATFDIPTRFCDDSDDGIGTVTGKSLRVTYTDFRDDTGIVTTWSDSATIQASTGSVSLDRNVYPVPTSTDNVVVHIEISDPDYNAESDVINYIESSQLDIQITPVSASDPVDIAGELKALNSNDYDGLADRLFETSENTGIFTETVEIPSEH